MDGEESVCVVYYRLCGEVHSFKPEGVCNDGLQNRSGLVGRLLFLLHIIHIYIYLKY